jgi:hypothetical protein
MHFQSVLHLHLKYTHKVGLWQSGGEAVIVRIP